MTLADVLLRVMVMSEGATSGTGMGIEMRYHNGDIFLKQLVTQGSTEYVRSAIH